MNRHEPILNNSIGKQTTFEVENVIYLLEHMTDRGQPLPPFINQHMIKSSEYNRI